MIPIWINLDICVPAYDVRKTKIKFWFLQNFVPQLQLLDGACEIV